MIQFCIRREVTQLKATSVSGLLLFVFINRAMTHNIASIRVLEMVGFQKEGIARQNVHINGKWEDHQILAILNPYS